MDLPRVATEEMVKAAALAMSDAVLPGLGPAAVSGLFAVWGRYRSDRFKSYVVELLKRGLDPAIFEDPGDGPIRLGLFDAGARHAAGAASDERVEQIAALVAGGFTVGRGEIVQRHFLLELLAQLNDVQVLLLIAASLPRPLQDDFWRTHQNALRSRRPTRFSNQEEVGRFAVHVGYITHLSGAGLIVPAGTKLTDLGRVLLHAIGQLPKAVEDPDPAYDAQQNDGSTRVPQYTEALRAVLVELAETFATDQRLAPPILLEPERGFSFGLEMKATNGDRHRLWMLQSSGSSYLQASFEIISPDGTNRPITDSPAARIDVRDDSAGVFAFIENSREYDIARAAEYLLEPLANALLHPADAGPVKRRPNQRGSHVRTVPRFVG
jgi:hypothetical protein